MLDLCRFSLERLARGLIFRVGLLSLSLLEGTFGLSLSAILELFIEGGCFADGCNVGERGPQLNILKIVYS